MGRRVRMMVCGRPKTAKTGGVIAPLLDAGFEVGVLNFDDNMDPVYSFASPEALTRLSVVTCQDRVRLGSGDGGGKDYVQVSGEPMALRRAFQALDNWDKADPEHPWGPVKTWGTNRVLVLDSLTSMGEAAFNRVRSINGRNRGNTRDSDWGVAMDDQANMLAKLMSSEFACHVICLAHLKIIGPKEPRLQGEKDEDLIDIKVAIAKANAELVPTRLYPSALGRALPQEVLRHVPAAVIADTIGDRRVFITKPRADVAADVGVPGKIKDTVDIEKNGILDIFEAITGHRKPY